MGLERPQTNTHGFIVICMHMSTYSTTKIEKVYFLFCYKLIFDHIFEIRVMETRAHFNMFDFISIKFAFRLTMVNRDADTPTTLTML